MTQDKAVDLAGLDSLSFDGGPDVEAFLSSALKDGLALADDGFAYESVQDAVDAASGWVFVGPGTFNESVTISTSGFTLVGAGYDTIIDSSDLGDAVTSDAPDVTIRNLSTRSNGSGSNNGITLNGQRNTVLGCVVRESTNQGIEPTATDSIVSNCEIHNTSSNAWRPNAPRAISVNNIATGIGNKGFQAYFSDDSIVTNCIVIDSNNTGLEINTDSIAIGCRVHNTGQDGSPGVDVNGSDSIIANSRVSDSGGSDIRTSSGSNVVNDGNLTGSAN